MRSSFIRAALVIASGTTLAQAIPFLLTPVLTRIYSPEEMGVFSLYTAFVVVFLGALSMGFGYAIVSADDGDVPGLVALCVRSILLLILPVSALAFVLIRFDLLGFGSLSPYAVISIVLSLLVTELFFVLRYVVLRDGHFRAIASATVSQSIARIGGQILLGLLGLGWWGLTLGDAAGRSFGIRSLARRVPFGIPDIRAVWSWSALRPLVSRYREFAKYSAPGAIIDSLSAQVVAPLLAAQFGLAVAGQYGLVMRLVILPVTLVGGAVADVFHQRLSQWARTKPQAVVRLFLSVAGALLVAGVILALAILIIGDGIWVAVLGEEWRSAGDYAVAIAPRAAVLMVVSPISRTVLVFGGQKFKLWFNVFNVALVIAAMELAKRLDWSALKTITAISWAQAGAGLVYLVLLLFITRRGSQAALTPESD